MLRALLPYAVIVATSLPVITASAQDDAVKALVAKLSDVDSDIRENAATNLRKLLASDKAHALTTSATSIGRMPQPSEARNDARRSQIPVASRRHKSFGNVVRRNRQSAMATR